MIYTLSYLKEQADEIESAWDGTDAGVKEDRAHLAKDLTEKLAEVEALIAELGI